VLPTVVEPLRADWADAQAAALLLAHEAAALDGRKRDDKLAEARAEIRRFHHRLCTVRVLDPACGSGNFLYVTLEHLKRLEAEVLAQADALGDTQARLGLEGETVTLQQLRGIELNERAAALAELVLWIGWLQWHIRSFGSASLAEPVIHDYGNIECRDAVLAWDGQEPMRDAQGRSSRAGTARPSRRTRPPASRCPTRARRCRAVALPQPAAGASGRRRISSSVIRRSSATSGCGRRWGMGTWRRCAGHGRTVPESADFVMYWWQHAAEAVRSTNARRFGLITTNSLTMIFNRRVVEAQQAAKPALHLAFAIPDHPWVDSADGAAVRIAMTVGTQHETEGRLLSVVDESPMEDGEVVVRLDESVGSIHSNLKTGAKLTSARALKANSGLSFMGMIPLGTDFWIDEETALSLGWKSIPGFDSHVRRYVNGSDLTRQPRNVLALDFFGLTADELRSRYPAAYQWLLDRVKPKREQDNRASYRELWWIFAEPRRKLRPALAGLARYIGTTETAKHRTFVFIDGDVLPDQKVRVVASDSGGVLGVLSSVAHVEWALATGGTLEDRPVYNNTTCFERFPFPSDDTGLTPQLAEHIRHLAEQIDAHRKARQALHDDVTLTGLYNVLAKLRAEEPLSAKDKLIHEHGLVAVLRSLHDELDAAVLQAYGWADLQAALADHRPSAAEARAAEVETLLQRLVELNTQRAAEEAAGTVRWLRPEFQTRAQATAAAGQGAQAGFEVTAEAEDAPAPPLPAAAPPAKRPWPAGLPEQIKAVAELLAASPQPLALAELEARFQARGRWRERLPTILDTLAALGRARPLPGEPARWAAG
jgi:hypothetical protein